MRNRPDFLEVLALVCTVVTGILSIADWWLKVIA